MTDTELRIAVAEALGLNPQSLPLTPNKVNWLGWFTPESAAWLRANWKVGSSVQVIPNWPESMDACRRDFLPVIESEKENGWWFWDHLFGACGRPAQHTHLAYLKIGACSTPRQWCEAFLEYRKAAKT